MKIWLLFIAILFLIGCTSVENSHDLANYKCPECNVILISIDTLRPDHLGCYGYNHNTSPNIDAFAKDSIVFEKFYSVSPWTLPSHASMFTSLYPSQHGAHSINGSTEPKMNFGIRKDVVTLPQILKRAGFFNVGITGGGYVSAGFGFGRGFDIYKETGFSSSANRSIEAFKELLPQFSKKHFFLFFHTYQVHAPHHPEQRFVNAKDSIKLKFLELLDGVSRRFELPKLFAYLRNGTLADNSTIHSTLEAMASEGTLRVINLSAVKASLWYNKGNRNMIIDLYDADIRQMDYYIGKMLRLLEKKGLLDHTIIIFTADHGEAFWERHDNKKTLTTGHHFLYNSPLNVPLIIHLPNTKPQRIQGLASTIDIMPTILGILGIPYDKNKFMGQSFFEPRKNIYFSEQFRSPGWKAVITPSYKYIQQIANKHAELYDLRTDPKETHNIISQHPQLIPLFIKMLEGYNKIPLKHYYARDDKIIVSTSGVQHAVSTREINLTRENMETLRKLGYLN